jgi:regulator of sirC expression with transglutaminase-like and TPR domain
LDWEAVLERQSYRDDDDIDIVETLLALSAADNPDRDLSDEHDHLTSLASGVSGPPMAKRLADRIGTELGYRGDSDTYDDMRNADIADVIARRRGLPVALGLLYILAGRQLDWSVAGMNFPGHFLVRVEETANEPRIMDPFDHGRIVTMKEVRSILSRVTGTEAQLHPMYMAAVPARQVLVRLQNNIKVRALQAGDVDRTVEVLRRISLFSPGESSVWLEMSGIEAGRGNMRRAIGLLEEGADHAPSEQSLQAMADARQALGRRLN